MRPPIPAPRTAPPVRPAKEHDMIDLQDARRQLTITARERRIAREEEDREIRWACLERLRRIRENRRLTRRSETTTA